MATEDQGIQITLKGLTEFNKKMKEGNTRMKEGKRLHARIGINLLKLVDKGFKTEGVAVTGKKWKSLAGSTRAARRKGPGRGGPKILQDSGDLRRSFAMDYQEKMTRVGTALKYSAYHEYGGKKSYKIVAKGLKHHHEELRSRAMLRFMNAQGQWVFRREVIHPPLPQRKMLPTKKIGQEIVNKTVDNFIKDSYKKVIS